MNKLSAGILLVLLTISLSACNPFKKKSEEVVALPTPKPEPVNLIPVEDRPFVSLQPLRSRNQLELVIDKLKIPADEVEVILSYDRNEGVMDAVYKTFFLNQETLTESLFMGSKSAGGHITYHDDVIGGELELRFSSEKEDYNLRVPWRYDDQNSPYTEISTADAAFQLDLEEPITDSKIVVMQSPGLPEELDGSIIAGPYVVRSVSDLPQTSATVSLRMDSSHNSHTLYGWNGQEWEEIESSANGRVVSATAPLYELYVLTE